VHSGTECVTSQINCKGGFGTKNGLSGKRDDHSLKRGQTLIGLASLKGAG